MNESKQSETPPCDIRIDKNGIWYFKGAEMIRKEIVQLFYQHLNREESGRYTIEMPNDRCYLYVEDVPFVVKAVYPEAASAEVKAIQLYLNDETLEELNPASLRIGKDNILYCSVKCNRFDARFSRASYYQIANFIEQDSGSNRFYLNLNEEKFIISSGDPEPEAK
jgi:uncharacterized protein